MKRPIIIGLTILAVTGLVGCSSPNNTKVESNTNQSTEMDSGIEAPISSDTKPYIGKVSSIVGNQVTIKLIDGDFELTDEMKNAMGIFEFSEEEMKQLESLQPGESIQLQDGSSIGMAAVGGTAESSGSFDIAESDSGMSIEDLKEQGIDIESDMKAQNEAIFNQIEFNGESKEITIPAGVKIFNGITGEEAKLSDIKKGSIVDFMIDEKTDTVISVQIRL